MFLKRKLHPNYKHGMTGTRIYNIWKGMKKRCHNPNDTGYYKYGAKGIKVNLIWRKSFIVFYQWAMKNGYNDSLLIDRINIKKDYKPSNCRWVTTAESARNTSTNHWITFKGETLCIADWAKRNGLSHSVIKMRIHRGLHPIKAITMPLLKNHSGFKK